MYNMYSYQSLKQHKKPTDRNLLALKAEVIVLKRCPDFILSASFNFITYFFITILLLMFYTFVQAARNLFDPKNNLFDRLVSLFFLTTLPEKDTTKDDIPNSMLFLFGLTILLLMRLMGKCLVRISHSKLQAAIMYDDAAYIVANHKKLLLDDNPTVDIITLYDRKPRAYPFSQILETCASLNIKTALQLYERLPIFLATLYLVYKKYSNKHIPDEVTRNILSFLSMEDIYSFDVNRDIKCLGYTIYRIHDVDEETKPFANLWRDKKNQIGKKNLAPLYDLYLKKQEDTQDIEAQPLRPRTLS